MQHHARPPSPCWTPGGRCAAREAAGGARHPPGAESRARQPCSLHIIKGHRLITVQAERSARRAASLASAPTSTLRNLGRRHEGRPPPAILACCTWEEAKCTRPLLRGLGVRTGWPRAPAHWAVANEAVHPRHRGALQWSGLLATWPLPAVLGSHIVGVLASCLWAGKLPTRCKIRLELPTCCRRLRMQLDSVCCALCLKQHDHRVVAQARSLSGRTPAASGLHR